MVPDTRLMSVIRADRPITVCFQDPAPTIGKGLQPVEPFNRPKSCVPHTYERHQDRVCIMWQEIWVTIVSEFSDIPDLSTMTRITLRLVVAAVLGGILGYERELKARSAGVRTHMLVAVGAALFVIGPLQSGMEMSDMSRVLQGVVQGIGFLGAGAIIVRASHQQVHGLTTAANIWATAGIGVLAGLGLEATAVLATFIVLMILAVVPLILPTPNHLDDDKKEP